MTIDEAKYDIKEIEEVQHRLENIDSELSKVRQILSTGLDHRIRVSREDVESIKWYVKGGGEASDDAKFAYRFRYDKEGKPYLETIELVKDLELFGEIRLGPYKYRLGGNQDQFINRIREV